MDVIDDGKTPSGNANVVNLKQAAASLGVHYMTAYRYVRQGRLAAERVGTEWRVSLAALAEFKTEMSPLSRPMASTDIEAAWAERLEACLLLGDETASWRVIEMALAAGRSPTYCYVDALAPALTSIGNRFMVGALDIADQHLATAVAVRLVARLGARFRRPGRSRGTVVFGAPPGELHSLPIAIVSDLVRFSGYDVLELGANVPAEAFVSAAARTPRLIGIGIGVTQSQNLPSAQLVVDAIRASNSDVPIVVGGLAVSEVLGNPLRGVNAYAGDGRQAVAIIETFAAERAIRRVV